MLQRTASLACLLVAVLLAGCTSTCTLTEKAANVTTVKGTLKLEEEAKMISVQHILIGFKGSVPGKEITRSLEGAQELAADVFKRATAGEDFDALVKTHTADAHPGIYKMANIGVTVLPGEQMFERGGMVKAFGDVSFSLAVGEIGMSVYDPAASKFGWHIIKRIE